MPINIARNLSATKQCVKCGVEKPQDYKHFTPRPYGPLKGYANGYIDTCKECVSNRMKERAAERRAGKEEERLGMIQDEFDRIERLAQKAQK